MQRTALLPSKGSAWMPASFAEIAMTHRKRRRGKKKCKSKLGSSASNLSLMLYLLVFLAMERTHHGHHKYRGLLVQGAGYVRLCPLRHQPIVPLVIDEETGTLKVGSGQDYAPASSIVDQWQDKSSNTLPQTDVEQLQHGGSNEETVTLEGRECPCAPGNYCLIGDGDTCGIPRDYRGEGGGNNEENNSRVGCFDLNSRTVFIRNAWPVVVLWYGALFIFLLATDNGRNARNYILSCFFPHRNRTTASRIVSGEMHVRDRMRSAALAQQRRLLLVAQHRQTGRRWTTARRDGHQEPQVGALVLKTKEYSRKDEVTRRTMGEDEHVLPCVPSDMPATPKRSNTSERKLHTHEDEMKSPGTPDTAMSSTFDESEAETNYQGQEEEEEITCTICLCPVEDGDRVGVLRCDHVFHVDCLKDWLRRRNVCPLCQATDVASPRFRRTVPRGDQSAVDAEEDEEQMSNEDEMDAVYEDGESLPGPPPLPPLLENSDGSSGLIVLNARPPIEGSSTEDNAEVGSATRPPSGGNASADADSSSDEQATALAQRITFGVGRRRRGRRNLPAPFLPRWLGIAAATDVTSVVRSSPQGRASNEETGSESRGANDNDHRHGDV